ncbi:twin-arginine translocase TatA/TatE family subunit [uncultured Microbacterium sp.]|uniref:twin-arginine translocase TatA/TatE family subunit n=1 Tax=uncultured Microbacterium sp. TaxID=191216 RepID=UPI0025E47397|nr:twin-arginine translocase TatA/TatE family subunit [uncultured Microbacterium sp.]
MGIFGNAFSGWHLLLILAVIVLLFGAAKLPALAKSVGQSVRILRSETKDVETDPANGAGGSGEESAETGRTGSPMSPA